ncbi:MAG: metallo-mystery pair system four-Cys motif protein [Leptospira sp.]|nr:metallo-mystery pair system four-Cys motif protein [Leptospira sp.]
MNFNIKTTSIYLAVSLLVLSSCSPFKKDKKEDNTALLALAVVATQGTAVSTINFNVVSGTSNVSCSGTIAGTIAGTTNTTLKDLRFYVHDVKLITSSGSKADFTLTNDNKWQLASGSNAYGSYPGVALLDFEDGTNGCSGGTTDTNKSIKGTSVVGNYVGVEFKIGVPFYLNHMDSTTASAPLNSAAMYWAWNSGYKFTKIEFTATSNNFFHLGSQSCTGNSTGPVNQCGIPNRPTISLTKSSGSFNATKDVVTLDLNALYNGADATGTGINTCMAGNTNAACQPIITNIGITPSTGASAATQSAFSIK